MTQTIPAPSAARRPNPRPGARAGRAPEASAVAAIVSRVPTRVICAASVPDSMNAAGVSPGFPSRIKSATDCGEMSHAHVDHERARKPRQGRPVEPATPLVGFRVVMAGHKRDGRRLRRGA